MGIEAAQGRSVKLHEEGGLFRLSVQRLYEKVCDRFDAKGVELRVPANSSKEFLLGDVPALTIDSTSGAIGLAGGVAIDEADEIVMPLAPGLLVAVGPPDGTRMLSDDQVDACNARQVQVAREYVVYRLSAHLAADVLAWR
jgi:hypothetical protein